MPDTGTAATTASPQMLMKLQQFSPTKSKRRARFPTSQAQLEHIETTLSYCDYTEEERAACFYAVSDYVIFKQQDLQLPRGLEARTKEGSQRYKETRKKAMSVVFREQARQRGGEGGSNELFIAVFYKEKTSKSVAEALARGKMDAEVVHPKPCISTNSRNSRRNVRKTRAAALAA